MRRADAVLRLLEGHGRGRRPAGGRYLLARYFVGLTVTDPVEGTYQLDPHLEGFSHLECTLPVGKKDIHVRWDGHEVTVEEKTAIQ